MSNCISDVGLFHPMLDVGNIFLVNGPDDAVGYPEKARDFVDAYWNGLVRSGRVDTNLFSEDVLWQSFCRAALERWVWILPMLGEQPHVGNPLLQFVHDRMELFIVQLFQANSKGDTSYVSCRPYMLT